MAVAYHIVIQDEEGNLRTDGLVEFRAEKVGQPLVNLFADFALSQPLDNPVPVPTGKRTVYLEEGGLYQVKSFAPGLDDTLRHVAMPDFGLVFPPRGAWDGGTSYNQGDMVSHSAGDSDVYAFASNYNNNLDNEPAFDTGVPVSDEHWTVLGLIEMPGPPGSSDVVGTSATSLAIGAGEKVFTVVEADRGWGVGARLRASSVADPSADFMEGIVTAYSADELTLEVDLVGGSGTHADWTINLIGEPGISTVDAASLGTAIHGASSKATPVDADELGLRDSVSGLLNKLTWANVKATLKTYFDTLYGRLASANAWSAAQTIAVSSGTPLTLSHPPGNAMSVTASGAAAGGGPIIILYRDNPSAANGDGLGQFTWLVKDASGNPSLTAQSLTSTMITATAGAVSTRFGFTTRVAGTNAQRMALASGLVVGSPTGGDQGVGTINAVGVYDDSVLLTCMPMAKEFFETGEVDLDKWDAMVPDLVIPASYEELPITEEAEANIESIAEDKDGNLVKRVERRIVQKQIVDLVPLYDTDGNGIDAIERPATSRVEVAEQVIKREHHTAHLFKQMLEDGFDPRDPGAYLAKMEADEGLPGMPNQSNWEHNRLSVGELFSRKWLAMELLAHATKGIKSELDALKAEVQSLRR